MDLLNPPNLAPSSALKECTSCWRDLPMRCFSLDRHQPDGHQVVCKDCASYRKRFCRHQVHEEFIIPLWTNNRVILETAFKNASSGVNVEYTTPWELPARGVKDRAAYLIRLDFKRMSPSITIVNATETQVLGEYRCIGAKRDRFFEVALDLLRDLRIRLTP